MTTESMATDTELKRPLVYDYDDYRDFLRDTYAFHKGRSRHYSFRNFSRRAGFASPNFLKLVIEGQRNLSGKSIARFSLALKLNRTESGYFSDLVHFNQAATPGERSDCARRLLQCKALQKVYPLKQAEFAYYACWYYIPVRELVALSDFREDAEWIAQMIFPPIKTSEAKQALRDLETLGLLKRSSSGTLEQARKTVATDNEVVSSSIADYHKEMLKKAADAIDTVPRTHREISAACMPVSRAMAEKIKDRLQAFRAEIIALAAEDDDPETIYQMNLQLFPLSDWQKGEQ